MAILFSEDSALGYSMSRKCNREVIMIFCFQVSGKPRQSCLLIASIVHMITTLFILREFLLFQTKVSSTDLFSMDTIRCSPCDFHVTSKNTIRALTSTVHVFLIKSGASAKNMQ